MVVGLAIANQVVSTASTFAHFFHLSRTSDEDVTNDMLYQTTVVIETVLKRYLSPLFKAVRACVGALVGLCKKAFECILRHIVEPAAKRIKRAFECILKHTVEPAAKRIKSGTSFLAAKISKYCKGCAIQPSPSVASVVLVCYRSVVGSLLPYLRKLTLSSRRLLRVLPNVLQCLVVT
jgi:hypothetical protein